MIPQSTAVRDMVKADGINVTEQAKVVQRQVADKVSEVRDSKKDVEKKESVSLETAVVESNKAAVQMNSQVRFEIDQNTKNVIVKVVNKDTGEVIREIPSEEMVKLASRMEELRGVIFDREIQ